MSNEKENELTNEEVNKPTEATPETSQEEASEDIMATLEAMKKQKENALEALDAPSSEPEIKVEAVADVAVEESTESDEVETVEIKNETDEAVPQLPSVDLDTLNAEGLSALASDLFNIDHTKLTEPIYAQFQNIKAKADQLFKVEEEQAKTKFLEEGGDAGAFEYKKSEVYNNIKEVFFAFKDKRANFYKALNQEKQGNLEEKQKIVNEVRALVETNDVSEIATKENSKNVKALQARWKEIGSVPKADADELYKTYQALIDMFYDSKRMAYEFQQLDREKNLKAKTIICEKAEALVSEENLFEAVKQLNSLHDEYKQVGPVPREQQEVLWQRFKSTSDKIYEAKREQSEEYKKQLQENMQLKQALCLRAEEYITFNSESIKEWNEMTKRLLSLQDEWEKVGPLPREVAKNINKQFWGNFKQFFANKQAFFNRLDEARKVNLEKKEELVKQAEAVKDSEEWEEAGKTLKSLQREWKEIGPVPESNRDQVYKQFKAACDHFFEKKRNKRQAQDQKFVLNLEKKLAVITDIEALAGSPDEEKLAALKQQFLEIGFVPRNDINSVMDKFTAAVDTYFAATDLSDDEKERQSLEVLVDIYQSGPDAEERLNRKTQTIRNKVQSLENDIALWKNNIQFFAKSKTADALTAEFAEKINNAEDKLQRLKRQMKIIRNV